MLLFAVRRAAQITLTLVLLALGTFAVLRAAPGGPVPVLIGADYWSTEREAELNRTLGLDQPLPIQLGLWGRALLTGDLGFSYFHRRPAGEVVSERIAPTLVLGATAWVISLVLGVGLGTLAAHRRGGLLDRAISACGVLALSTPTFWLGILLIVVFAAWLNVLPAWPGVGHLTVSSVARRDYPVLMVIALVVGCVVVATTFLTDVVYRWLDPRLGYE